MDVKKKRPCQVCGMDLNLWGESKRKFCPSCSKARNETFIPCAGSCGKRHQIRAMNCASIFFDAGKKGGKKIVLYYCNPCFLAAKGRAVACYEKQDEQLKNTERRLSRPSQKENSI